MRTLRTRKSRAEKVFQTLREEFPRSRCSLEHGDAWQLLVATILSAQCTDARVNQVTPDLFRAFPAVADFAEAPLGAIEEAIRSTGFYRNKAKSLQGAARAMIQRHGGEVPDRLADLVKLPGVGRKTANLVRAVGFNKPAICVDTHVHRIMNIWCYVDTDTPLKTEMALRAKLPEKHWITVNSILVAFGQSLCKPVRPHCDICPLQGACPQNGVTPRSVKASSQPTEKHNGQPLKLISWNVNGIRAVEKKGFAEIVADLDADILALQETKAHPDQLSDKLKDIDGYTSYWHSAEKKGYSGVAVYTRQEPLKVIEGLGIEEFDREGRVLTLEFDSYYFTNIYFPNAGGGLKRLEFKIAFNHALLAFTDNLKKHKHVVLCGDFNVAHKPIDLKNPASNTQNAGFTQDERDWMDSFIEAGYLDTFRMFNQDPEQYTWWSYRFNARAKNIGWRIDYFCVDSAGATRVQNAEILPEILGSDHCPVVLHWAS